MTSGDTERNGGRREKRTAPPLDDERLRELALRYVGRFATTRARLLTYLRRKLRERGWAGEGEPDLMALADRLVELRYVDDAGYALSKANALTSRGYGEGRVRQALTVAGVGDEDGRPAREAAAASAVEAALKFARRRRIGPYAGERGDPAARQKALAAMVRAGHSFSLAKKLVDAEPGAELTEEELFF